jgi:photosystem II stability/assembly factor-like uncharacterized protein
MGLVAAMATSAGNGIWTSSGPDGGVIYEVRFDPVTPTTMYATTRGGFFKSDDGGITWNASNDGLVDVTNAPLIIDPEAPGHLYLFDFGNRLYRSTDYGASWTPTGYVAPSDSFPWFAADEPGSSGRFYVAFSTYTGSVSSPLLLRTSDGGLTFSVPGSGLPNQPFYDVEIDPGNANVILASIEYRITNDTGPVMYRSIDGGATWNPVGPGDASYSYEISHGAGTFPNRTVYASIDGQLQRSVDSGLTFTPTTSFAQQVLAHPTIADTVYFSDDGMAIGPQRSADGGATATPITTGLTSNPSYVDGSARAVTVQPVMFNASPDFPGPGSSLWLSTYGDGLFRSLDGGTSWSTSHIGLRAANIRALAVHPNALTASPTTGAGRNIYAGFGDTFFASPALYRSVDGGGSWNPLNTGLRASLLRALAFDPTSAGVGSGGPPPPVNNATIYAAGRASLIGTPERYRESGLYKSTNAGLSWSVLDGGLPRFGVAPNDYADLGTVRGLALDPRSCAAPPPSGSCTSGPLQTLYAVADGTRITSVDTTSVPGTRRTTTTMNFQIVRSGDGGTSWVQRDGAASGFVVSRTIRTCPASPTPPNNCTGPTILEANHLVRPNAVVHSPSNSNVLYVGTYLASPPSGTLPPPDPVTGVYKSVDGGATWTAVNNGLPLRAGSSAIRHDTLALAIHPSNDQIVWATTVDLSTTNTGTIYKTVDGGASWTESGQGLRGNADIRALAVDTTDPSGNTLYAAGAGTPSNPGAVYTSEDGGATWRSISVGLPADSALSIAVDPFNASVIHAGTNTGIWSLTQVPDGDGDGVPDGTENNAPGGGDGNADGQPDAAQREVGSTVVIFRRPEGSGGFFTSDVQFELSTPSFPGGCQQAVDVQAQLAAIYGRDYTPDGQRFHKYPRDLVRFEVVDCSRAIVDLTFHNADFRNEYGWSFRFYGPLTPGDDDSIRWSPFASRAQLQAGSNNKWRLTLDANQFGSYRPSNHSVLFVGGPACFDDRLFRNNFETQADTGPPTCDH